MAEIMTSRRELLSSLLRPLVREWGHGEVETVLKSLGGEVGTSSLQSARPRRARKPLATEQVSQLKLLEPQATTLLGLAGRFDRKEFLPSVADVREFMAMSGERPGELKDRSEAFRKLLPLLMGLPQERVERLLESSRHSGPSRLGPLSDAISSASASFPRYVRQEREIA